MDEIEQNVKECREYSGGAMVNSENYHFVNPVINEMIILAIDVNKIIRFRCEKKNNNLRQKLLKNDDKQFINCWKLSIEVTKAIGWRKSGRFMALCLLVIKAGHKFS